MVCLALALSMALLSCSTQKQIAHQTTIVVFGTLVDIVIYHDQGKELSAQAAVQQVEQQFHQFHQQWHAWEQGGIVSKINQAIKEQKPIEVANSVKQFILKSQTLTEQSQGLFDPGIGQLVALWGFHADEWLGPPPKNQLIHHWLASQPSLLDVYFQGHVLHSHNPNVQLDFGGNAKGLAIDMALASLLKSGIQNAIVSIGGDMKAIGAKNNQPWSVGIQDPKNPTHLFASIQLQDQESIVTSGTYQRYFEWQGQRYTHILNPKTGYPAQSFASVTVLHPDAITADAAATAILIAGPKNWLAIAQSMGINYVFGVDNQGQIFQTEAITHRINLLKTETASTRK